MKRILFILLIISTLSFCSCKKENIIEIPILYENYDGKYIAHTNMTYIGEIMDVPSYHDGKKVDYVDVFPSPSTKLVHVPSDVKIRHMYWIVLEGKKEVYYDNTLEEFFSSCTMVYGALELYTLVDGEYVMEREYTVKNVFPKYDALRGLLQIHTLHIENPKAINDELGRSLEIMCSEDDNEKISKKLGYEAIINNTGKSKYKEIDGVEYVENYIISTATFVQDIEINNDIGEIISIRFWGDSYVPLKIKVNAAIILNKESFGSRDIEILDLSDCPYIEFNLRKFYIDKIKEIILNPSSSYYEDICSKLKDSNVKITISS